MRTADILMTSALGSPQTFLYGTNYTHAALYLGGDSDGTPLIAEAVTAVEASSFGQVRALPLELSPVYQGCPTSVAVFRATQPLTYVQRAAIASLGCAEGYGWTHLAGVGSLGSYSTCTPCPQRV